MAPVTVLRPAARSSTTKAKAKTTAPSAAPPRDLTERQLAWLRRNVPGFAEAQDQVRDSDARAARIAAKLGLGQAGDGG